MRFKVGDWVRLSNLGHVGQIAPNKAGRVVNGAFVLEEKYTVDCPLEGEIPFLCEYGEVIAATEDEIAVTIARVAMGHAKKIDWDAL
jgi:hypothetical protein